MYISHFTRIFFLTFTSSSAMLFSLNQNLVAECSINWVKNVFYMFRFFSSISWSHRVIESSCHNMHSTFHVHVDLIIFLSLFALSYRFLQIHNHPVIYICRSTQFFFSYASKVYCFILFSIYPIFNFCFYTSIVIQGT